MSPEPRQKNKKKTPKKHYSYIRTVYNRRKVLFILKIVLTILLAPTIFIIVLEIASRTSSLPSAPLSPLQTYYSSFKKSVGNAVVSFLYPHSHDQQNTSSNTPSATPHQATNPNTIPRQFSSLDDEKKSAPQLIENLTLAIAAMHEQNVEASLPNYYYTKAQNALAEGKTDEAKQDAISGLRFADELLLLQKEGQKTQP